MKLGIMQPYFFPYLGYFSLVANTDYFVFFDTAQYEKRSWMNRNRILNANGEISYITVPLKKASQKTEIRRMEIDYSQDWASSMLSQLVLYKKRAPYYCEVSQLFTDILRHPYSSLAELNIATIRNTCIFLGIPTPFETFSNMDVKIKTVKEPDEWALEITKALHYDTYRNPPGGKAFFDAEKYSRAGIKLEFLTSTLPPYIQRIGRFEGGLSIIDVMMFNSKEETRNMLKEFTLE